MHKCEKNKMWQENHLRFVFVFKILHQSAKNLCVPRATSSNTVKNTDKEAQVYCSPSIFPSRFRRRSTPHILPRPAFWTHCGRQLRGLCVHVPLFRSHTDFSFAVLSLCQEGQFLSVFNQVVVRIHNSLSRARLNFKKWCHRIPYHHPKDTATGFLVAPICLHGTTVL